MSDNVDQTIEDFKISLDKVNDLLRRLTMLAESMSVSSNSVNEVNRTISSINSTLMTSLNKARSELLDKNQLFTNQIENIVNNLYLRIEEFEEIFSRTLIDSFSDQLNALHEVLDSDIKRITKNINKTSKSGGLTIFLLIVLIGLSILNLIS